MHAPPCWLPPCTGVSARYRGRGAGAANGPGQVTFKSAAAERLKGVLDGAVPHDVTARGAGDGVCDGARHTGGEALAAVWAMGAGAAGAAGGNVSYVRSRPLDYVVERQSEVSKIDR